MVKRIIKTQISSEALEKIKSLKSSSGKTSSQIIDEALEQLLDGASGMNSELLKSVNSNEAFIKRAINNPNYLKLDNTKPANVVIDAAILSLWVYDHSSWGQHQRTDTNFNVRRDYAIRVDSPFSETTVITRADIMQTVKKHMESSIDGTSWADFYKSWFDPSKYKGKFQVTVDNRIKSLVSNGVIQSVTEAEWRIIKQQKELDSKDEDEKQWLKGYGFFVDYKKRPPQRTQVDYALVSGPNPEDPGFYNLGEWVYAQREAYYKGTLPAEKIEKLNAAGIVWDKAEEDWENQCSAFDTYTKENPGKPISIEALKAESMHGGGVYKIDERNKLHVLAEWVLEQRTAYWRETLPDEKINKLDAAGIVWDQSKEEWDAMYLLLVAYKKEFSNGLSSRRDIDEIAAHGLWSRMHIDEIAARWAKLDGTTSSEWEISLLQLQRWVLKQRRDYNKGELSRNQSEHLKEAGVNIGESNSYTGEYVTDWEKDYRAFVAYTKENPGIPITLHYKLQAPVHELTQLRGEGRILLDTRGWVNRTRSAYWNLNLPAEKIEKLEAAGFVWSESEEEWEAMFLWYKELKSTEFPNVQVPIKATYQGHYPIGKWVSSQRTAYNKGELTPRQIDRLEKEGMVWDVYEEQWQKAYRALIAYTKENPGKPISENTKYQNISIGKWISAQRLAINQKTLSDARMQSIWKAEKSIGMDDPARIDDPVRGVYRLNRELSEDEWTVIMAILKIKPQRGISIPKIINTSNSWQALYREFVDYQEENPDVPIPTNAKYHGLDLGRWVQTQRTTKNKGTLSDERIKLLEDVGIVWDPIDDEHWQALYREFVDYQEENPDVPIPTNAKYHNFDLGRWVQDQQTAKNKGTLSDERIELLEDVGIVWDSFK